MRPGARDERVRHELSIESHGHMDTSREQTVELLKAQTPEVAAQVADKRMKLSDAWLDECRRRELQSLSDPLYFETLTFEDRFVSRDRLSIEALKFLGSFRPRRNAAATTPKSLQFRVHQGGYEIKTGLTTSNAGGLPLPIAQTGGPGIRRRTGATQWTKAQPAWIRTDGSLRARVDAGADLTMDRQPAISRRCARSALRPSLLVARHAFDANARNCCSPCDTPSAARS